MNKQTFNREDFQTLFVFHPKHPEGHVVEFEDTSIRTQYTTAYHTRAAAQEARDHENRHSVYDTHWWYTPAKEAVRYATIRGTSILATGETGAPLSFWALIDFGNGNPEIKDGKIYLFCFDSREQARLYSKYLAAERASGRNVIEVSPPIQFFQQVTSNRRIIEEQGDEQDT